MSFSFRNVNMGQATRVLAYTRTDAKLTKNSPWPFGLKMERLYNAILMHELSPSLSLLATHKWPSWVSPIPGTPFAIGLKNDEQVYIRFLALEVWAETFHPVNSAGLLDAAIDSKLAFRYLPTRPPWTGPVVLTLHIEHVWHLAEPPDGIDSC